MEKINNINSNTMEAVVDMSKLYPLMEKCLRMSELAYLNPNDIESALGFESVEFEWIANDQTDTQCFICYDGHYVFVVFRGTEFDNLRDWMTNLDCKLIPWEKGRVHHGFWKDVDSVILNILSGLTKYRLSGKKIIITGHSQGAADASILFGEMAMRYNFVPDYCFPIESPRVMDREAVESLSKYKEKIHATVHNNDIVCRVPARIMGYGHQDRILWYFDEDGVLHHSITWWERFKDRMHGRIEDFFELGTDGIKDHDIGVVRNVFKSFLPG